MKKYIRDSFLFQIERDKGEKIKSQLLDSEFHKLANYIDSVVSYIGTIQRGEFVGKQGFNNFLFKNKGNRVVLERIDDVSLQYTFSNFRNSFFVYNSRYQENVYAYVVPNTINNVLKYKNNNFVFEKIALEDFRIASLNASDKIVLNSLDFNKILGFNDYSFFKNQEKLVYANQGVRIIRMRGVEHLKYFIDTQAGIPQRVFSNYNDVSSNLGFWFDYMKKNKFSIKKRLEPYLTMAATDKAKYDEMQKGIDLLGLSVIAGTVKSHGQCPVNTISAKSITSIFMNSSPMGGTHTIASKASGTYRLNKNGVSLDDIKIHNFAQFIPDLEFYFAKMFWGEKQIVNRLLSKKSSLFYNVAAKKWFIRQAINSVAFTITKTQTPATLQVINNYHIANNCFEQRHFADKSISLNSIARNNKIPIQKFNRVFLTRIGV